MVIEIPTATDVQEITELFKTTLNDLYHREGIIQSHADDLRAEIEAQIEVFSDYLSVTREVFEFRIIRFENNIIGTMALGEPNKIIKENLEFDYRQAPEIKSVYILPAYQKHGAGNLLFKTALDLLEKRGYEKFCLDCGYSQSQSYWKKLLGEPAKKLTDYWGAGAHHMIWLTEISRVK